MYLFDPDRGRRRRALVRDKLVSARHQLRDASDVTATDVLNRTTGQVARLRSLLRNEAPSDEALLQNVRRELGFIVAHPKAIDVAVDQSRVTLSGPVLADEVEDLLSAVSTMRGVTSVDNRLTVHREPGSVPALQGPPARRGRPPWLPWSQHVWSPAQRLGAGLFATALTLWGARARGLTGMLVGFAGIASLLRALTNKELRELVPGGQGQRSNDSRRAAAETFTR